MAQARCEKCNRDFVSEESLNQHNNSKHSSHEERYNNRFTEKQKKSVRNWSIFIVVFILIVGGVVYLTIKNSSSTTISDKYSGMYKCHCCISSFLPNCIYVETTHGGKRGAQPSGYPYPGDRKCCSKE